MRKSRSLILGLALALSLPGTTALAAKTSADFKDLQDLDAATKAKIDALLSAGVFNGVSQDTFDLKSEMNRAQFAKVAAMIFGLEVDSGLKTSSFNDVKPDDKGTGYALPYIEALKNAGIAEGYGGGRFDPAGKVTKEQLATFLVRGLGKDDDAKSAPGVDDQTVSDWAKGYVELALELKLLSNGADGKFGGGSNATRDLLVLGAYEAKEQYVPRGATPTPTPSPSLTPTPSASPSPSPTPSAAPPIVWPTPEPTSTATPTVQPTPTASSTPTATPTPTASPTPTPAPAITGLTVESGTVAGSVRLVYEAVSGNGLRFVHQPGPFVTPKVGSSAAEIGSEYETGADIRGVYEGEHIGVYEVNASTGAVVRFSDIALTAA